MMRKPELKTNAVRILDQMGIAYHCTFCNPSLVNAIEVAEAIGIDAAAVYKTLVTIGKTKAHYVFMIPSEKELDLKKAAKAAGEKSLNMVPVAELFSLTGYVHGGCSPIAMSRLFPTFIDLSAEKLEHICFSAGRVGHQIHMPLVNLQKVLPVTPAPLTK